MPTVALKVSAHELNAGDVYEAIALAAKMGLDRSAGEVILQFNGRDIHVDPSAPWAACGRWLHTQMCEYISDVRANLGTRLDKLEAERIEAAGKAP